ncbi:MAG TPA: peptidylprolyl isomerase [Candidatus Angelobacter sp.]|nr:peptidylprolyl isomerase [Candidatus Angelobacter sp.]
MKKFSSISAALLTLVVFVYAVHADNIVDEIIARVNDQIITRSQFERAKQSQLQELKQQFPSDWQSRWAAAQKDVLREMIDEQLLLEKGKELGITGETETVKQLNKMRQEMGLPTMQALEDEAKKQGISFEDYKESIRTRVVTQQVIGQEVGSKIGSNITEQEVQNYYNQHKQEMSGPEEITLSEILVSSHPKPSTDKNAQSDTADKTGEQSAAEKTDDQSTAEDPALVAKAEAKAKLLYTQLKTGAKFDDLAKKESDGPTAAQGGPLGTFKKGELAKEFEDATMSLKPGDFTQPIRTKQGFLILKVDDHRPAGIPPLKEVEDRIRDAIYAQKLEPAARAYLTKLREQAYIEVKPGYVDSGATAGENSNHPEVVAANGGPGSHHDKNSGLKKKKKFLIF